MTINAFLALLTSFSIITSLFTEAVKKFLEGLKISYASNIVVLITSIVVGIGGMCAFFEMANINHSYENCIFIVLMALANWLVAMVGYDKVKQAIIQLKGGGIDGKDI